MPVSGQCVLCGGNLFRPMPTETMVIRAKHPRQVVRCVKCGLVSVSPMPSEEELVAFYEQDWLIEDYARTQPQLYPVGDLKPEPHIVRRLEILRAKTGGGRILDVGAANGVFLSAARETGWEVHGLELAASSVAEARRAFGLELVRATLETSSYPDGYFDVIHLSHVLEHLNRPLVSLRRAHALLKPGGIIFIEVPNEFGELFNLVRCGVLRRAPLVYSVPTPHVYFYTAATLSAMVRKAGFRGEKLETPYRNPELGSRILMGGLVKRCIYAAGTILKMGPVLDIYAYKPGN